MLWNNLVTNNALPETVLDLLWETTAFTECYSAPAVKGEYGNLLRMQSIEQGQVMKKTERELCNSRSATVEIPPLADLTK